jgi:hypothetical protein
MRHFFFSFNLCLIPVYKRLGLGYKVWVRVTVVTLIFLMLHSLFSCNLRSIPICIKGGDILARIWLKGEGLGGIGIRIGLGLGGIW